MMKIKQHKSDELKEAVANWKASKDPHPRRIIVIAPLPNKEQRRVLLVHPSEGASAFDLDHKDVSELIHEVGSSAALLVDLAALGVAPLPQPVPPPGPIGDDTIYAAALNVFGTAHVLGQLVNLRAAERL